VFANETNLLKEARRGSEEAFVTLYHRYRSLVFRFAWRMTGSVTTAEDVTQECFLALVRGAAFNGARSSLRNYLFGMARHLVLHQLRVSQREAEESCEAAAPVDILDDFLEAERSELVRHAIACLPPLQREAIILFEYEELSLEDIAKITGAGVGAVKARLQRARESLGQRLKPLLFQNIKRSCS
jgi:RNA polymerase sigma-70 factor (ECF subfamily)